MITWSRMNRLRKPVTEKNYRIMRRAYMEAGRSFVDRVKKYGIQVLTSSDIKTADIQPVIDAYEKIVTDTVLEFARMSRKAFPKLKKFDAEEYEESRWVRDIESRITVLIKKFSERLYTTTYDEIVRIAQTFVTTGVEQGWSIQSIADLIEQGFMKEWGDASKWMARRVAQTETIRASNYGTKEGVNSLGVEYTQSWLATNDGRERDSHARAERDNQNIPSDQLFVIVSDDDNQYECEYPGDPRLPPEESINCRCSWSAAPVD